MRARDCSGLSYVEVLVAVALLAVFLLPVLESLHPAILGTSVSEVYVQDQLRLQSRFEDVMSEPFSALESAAAAAGSPSDATAYSDASGTDDRLLVYIWAYDGDNDDGDNNPFSGTDEGLLWVRIVTEDSGHARESLVSRY